MSVNILIFIIASAILAVFSVVCISNVCRRKSSECVIARQPVVAEERVVTLSDIEYCIRKEGYIPVMRDNYFSFKISGEEFDVFYNPEDKQTAAAREHKVVS